jgi:CSLREA domain-containing protein
MHLPAPHPRSRSFAPLPLALLTALLAGALALMMPRSAQAQIFIPEITVTTLDDDVNAADPNPGDGTCDDGTGDCTLRAAIQTSNATPNVIEEIVFADGLSGDVDLRGADPGNDGFSQLPEITSTVFITGPAAQTAPSGIDQPAVFIDGQGQRATDNGLDVRGSGADGTIIDGIGIKNMPDDGIQVDSTVTSPAVSNVVIRNNVIRDNGGNGIDVYGTGTVVGVNDSGTGTGNAIHGNGGNGIEIRSTVFSSPDPSPDRGNDTAIRGNLIGYAVDNTPDGNGENGIQVFSVDNTLIGDADVAGGGNLISANDGHGIFDEHTTGTTIEANNVGTEPGGNAVDTFAPTSSNGKSGIFMGSDDTEASGTNSPVPVQDPVIGGSADAKNVVAGNGEHGIVVGEVGFGSDVNDRINNAVVSDNHVGVSRDGTTALPNNRSQGDFHGIRGNGQGHSISNNVVGGTREEDQFSGGGGIVLENGGGGHAITDNYVGTNANGADLGNRNAGIEVQGNTDPADGRPNTDATGNVVGFNDGIGILVATSSAVGSGHRVVNNYVGTNANGDDLGNGGAGIVARQDLATIGEATRGNVVGFNGGTGIRVDNAEAAIVQGNFVGVTSGGSDIGNSGAGIRVEADVDSSAIGTVVGYPETARASSSDPSLPTGTPSASGGGKGNDIAYNGSGGIVLVEGDPSETRSREGVDEVAIRGNATFANTASSGSGLGIDLSDDGTTANDNPSDGDIGPNLRQNFPEIDESSTEYDAGTDEVTVRYRIFCDPTNNCAYPLVVDFYVTDGTGEGETYVGTREYEAVDNGSYVTSTLSVPSGASVSRSDNLVATATDQNGNTSEQTATSARLPVEIVSLSALAAGTDVQVTWKTASETGNAGFTVEHRAPSETGAASAWRDAGFVRGAGTTNKPQRYTWTLEDPVPGVHTFRLRQRDLDGSTTLSRTVTAKVQIDGAYTLAVVPNPVRQQGTVTLRLRQAQAVRVDLYDVLGRRVKTIRDGRVERGTHTMTVAVGGLSSGPYFLRVDGETFTTTRRVVVVR